ncbi:PF20097 family protein [Anaerofustis butyriciformans]|uniref:PF20097 family protein n=1 Tax=Anaerofustis butyriciformans TaxID=3108533 RepID=UPI003F89D01B
MKCLDCGLEMEEGSVIAYSLAFGVWNEFITKKEAEKKGFKAMFRKTITIPLKMEEQKAWHCPNCKKVLMWVDSKE